MKNCIEKNMKILNNIFTLFYNITYKKGENIIMKNKENIEKRIELINVKIEKLNYKEKSIKEINSKKYNINWLHDF